MRHKKTKFCSGCNKTLPLTEFDVNRSSATGLQFYCRECSKNKRNARTEANKRHWANNDPYKGSQ